MRARGEYAPRELEVELRVRWVRAEIGIARATTRVERYHERDERRGASDERHEKIKYE